MKNRRQFRKIPNRKSRAAHKWLCLAVVLITAERQARLLANPTGLNVGYGSASARTIGSQLNVTVSSAAFLNWSSFNIQAGETTRFLQPSANSVVVNLIGDRNPSQIFGNLNANGTVILANANGFYFGPNSMIKVGGNFIATTAPLAPDFGTGTAWTYTGLPPLASIVNYGQIQTGQGRSLYLIAENIENHGTLDAPAGDIGLYGGESVLVSDSPDGRGLSATVKVPKGAVDNLGRITADAGTIAMQAQVVNQSGLVQANSVREQNGVIELVAADSLTLGPNSIISAHGDDSTPDSSGGTVTLKSGNTFSDTAGSRITTAGSASGGNGGNMEVSAPDILSLNSDMNSRAASGWTAGQLLLDPINVNLVGTGASTTPPNSSGTVDGSANPPNSVTWNLNVNTAFQNKHFSQITVEASGNISLSTAWNLSSTTGESSGLLKLEAGGNLALNNRITDANDWSVAMYAGYDPGSQAVVPKTGTISFGGSSNPGILTAQGSVSLSAGQSILLNAGYVNTTAGGGITMNAVSGDINAGTLNAYPAGYGTPYHSGINTFAGGNVTLSAGNNIVSNPAYGQNPAGSSGAYGAGDVTLIAGNEVKGYFQVADGIGTILAGVSVAAGQPPQILNPKAVAGDAVTPLTLSVTTGSWNVWSASEVYLEEVRNLSGTFDSGGVYTYGSAAAPGDSTAALKVWAGDNITLDGLNLGQGRNNNVTEPVYPPILSLSAGAGGITLNSSPILFPSTQGSLQISTSLDRGKAGGTGDLTGGLQLDKLTGIVMSDGNPADYTTFLTGPAHTSPTSDSSPVVLNIAGSINSFGLTVPTFAHISVGGDANNFGFLGQNSSPNQTTFIKVAGKIAYRGDLTTSDPLGTTLPPELLDPAVSGLPPELLSKLFYDAATGTLTFVGVMSQAEQTALLNAGYNVLDQNGDVTGVVPVPLDPAVINKLYADSQSATTNDQGLGLYGPGHFQVTASTIDLATSGGIFVNTAPLPTFALPQTAQPGADLTVTTTGDLDMTASQIANAGWQGGINVSVGGTLNVGGANSSITIGDTYAPKGIFTESSGNVVVLVQKDVNVNDSRIAAYNGGGVTVESFNGNVDAGSGGNGHVNVDAVQIDPVTGELVAIPTVGVAGSGILATTIPGSDAELGNILVETPRGNSVASQGGILQIGLNGKDDSKAIAALLSGYELRDANGNPITAATLDNPRVQGVVATGAATYPAQTVLIGGQQLTVSAPVWSELLTLLGVTPAIGQALNLQVTADQPAFIAALATGGAAFDPFNFTTFISADRNIDAHGSGIVAQNVLAEATGEVSGLFVGFNSVTLNANVIGSGIAFGPTVSISDASSSGSGSGPSIQVISENPVSVNGVSEAATAPETASVAKQVATTTEDENIQSAKAANTDAADDQDPKKKKGGKEIGLARRVSRVTVLLPQKN